MHEWKWCWRTIDFCVMATNQLAQAVAFPTHWTRHARRRRVSRRKIAVRRETRRLRATFDCHILQRSSGSRIEVLRRVFIRQHLEANRQYLDSEDFARPLIQGYDLPFACSPTRRTRLLSGRRSVIGMPLNTAVSALATGRWIWSEEVRPRVKPGSRATSVAFPWPVHGGGCRPWTPDPQPLLASEDRRPGDEFAALTSIKQPLALFSRRQPC